MTEPVDRMLDQQDNQWLSEEAAYQLFREAQMNQARLMYWQAKLSAETMWKLRDDVYEKWLRTCQPVNAYAVLNDFAATAVALQDFANRRYDRWQELGGR